MDKEVPFLIGYHFSSIINSLMFWKIFHLCQWKEKLRLRLIRMKDLPNFGCKTHLFNSKKNLTVILNHVYSTSASTFTSPISSFLLTTKLCGNWKKILREKKTQQTWSKANMEDYNKNCIKIRKTSSYSYKK